MTDPKGNECWVHWEYSLETWKAWALLHLEEDKQEAKNIWMWTVLPIMSAGLGAWAMSKQSGDHPARIGALFGLALGLAVACLAKIAPKLKYRGLLHTRPEVYIGPKALYRGKKHFPWHSVGWHLRTVSLLDGPPCELLFGFDQQGQGTYRMNIFVPVPAGGEPAAADIVVRVREAARLT